MTFISTHYYSGILRCMLANHANRRIVNMKLSSRPVVIGNRRQHSLQTRAMLLLLLVVVVMVRMRCEILLHYLLSKVS